MKRKKCLAALAMTAALVGSTVMPISATQITEGETANTSTSISVVKENPAPVFTVGIPAEITVNSAEPAKLVFTMKEDCLKTIPEDKKVSVSIADAGYGDVSGKFAVYCAETGVEATYGLYGSKYSTRPSDAYAIGDLFASFYGNETVKDGEASISRVIKVDNYDELSAGNYQGTLTFHIDVRNK